MEVVLAWLGRQALVIYIVCLLVAVAYVFAAGAARRRRDIAQFSLEREVYQQRIVRAWLMVALALALGGLVFLVRTFVLPPLPTPQTAPPTARVGLFTPTPQVAPLLSEAQATPVLTSTGVVTSTTVVTPVIVSAPTAAVTATPTPSPTPVPQDSLQPDCPSPDSQITSPVAGSNVSGIVEVRGTARTEAFSYYKFEVKFPGSNTPNFISQYVTPVENGDLGPWDISDPTRYPSGGPYQFQLVVVDIYGNTTTCTIPVNIVSAEN